MRKSFLTCTLAAILLTASVTPLDVPITASAASDEEIILDGVCYTRRTDELNKPYYSARCASGFRDKASTVHIYGSVTDDTGAEVPVKSVDDQGFCAMPELLTVQIDEGIQVLEHDSFRQCSKLKHVSLPQSLKVIGAAAFSQCKSLNDVRFGDNISQIGWQAFWGTNLVELVLPESVAAIGSNTFTLDPDVNAAGSSVTLPSTLNYVWSDAFRTEGLTLSGKAYETVYFNGSQRQLDVLKKLCKDDDKYYDTSIFATDQIICKDESNDIVLNYDLEDKFHSEVFSENDSLDKILLRHIKDGKTAYEYNPKLAHMLSVLAASAYDSILDLSYNLCMLDFDHADEKQRFSWPATFGLHASSTEQVVCPIPYGEHHNYKYTDWQKNIDNVGYSFAKKSGKNGEKDTVMVIVRGTQGPLEGILTNKEWQSDLFGSYGSGGDLRGYHRGFGAALDMLMKDLESYLSKNKLDKTACRFIITGHSRGAAVANLVAHKLGEDGVDRKEIYDYNFACPDSHFGFVWESKKKDGNIFNLSNTVDPVSLIPGRLGTQITRHSPVNMTISQLKEWTKYGNAYWYSYQWESDYKGFDSHKPANYVALFRKEAPLSEFTTSRPLLLSQGKKRVQLVSNNGTFHEKGIYIEVYRKQEKIAEVKEGEFVKLAEWPEDEAPVSIEQSANMIDIITADDSDVELRITAEQDTEVQAIVESTNAETYYPSLSLSADSTVNLTVPAATTDTAAQDVHIYDGTGEEIKPAERILYGDINEDGKYSIADAVVLQKYLLTTGTLTEAGAAAADLDRNGALDAADMTLLKRRLLLKC